MLQSVNFKLNGRDLFPEIEVFAVSRFLNTHSDRLELVYFHPDFQSSFFCPNNLPCKIFCRKKHRKRQKGKHFKELFGIGFSLNVKLFQKLKCLIHFLESTIRIKYHEA